MTRVEECIEFAKNLDLSKFPLRLKVSEKEISGTNELVCQFTSAISTPQPFKYFTAINVSVMERLADWNSEDWIMLSLSRAANALLFSTIKMSEKHVDAEEWSTKRIKIQAPSLPRGCNQ